MRRSLIAFLLFFVAFAGSVLSQTTSSVVSLTLRTSGGTVVPDGVLTFDLMNCGRTVSNPIATMTADGAGIVSGTIPFSNDSSFVCVNNNSYYKVTATDSTHHILWSRSYQILSSSTNLSAPLTSLPATVQPADFSGGTSGTAIDSVARADAAARAATGTCPTGQYENGDTTSGPGCNQVNYSQLAGTFEINSVPLCNGFSPLNNQLLEYTTASTPDPCYTAVSNISITIASGTAAMPTSPIASGTCLLVPETATGADPSKKDVVFYSATTDATAVAGYSPSSSGSLYIWDYITVDNVNFKICNNTSGSITPGSLILNWTVIRELIP